MYISEKQKRYIKKHEQKYGPLEKSIETMRKFANDGWSFNYVAAQVGISGSSIYRYCRMFKEIDEIRLMCRRRQMKEQYERKNRTMGKF